MIYLHREILSILSAKTMPINRSPDYLSKCLYSTPDCNGEYPKFSTEMEEYAWVVRPFSS